jgi:hypothetical protein
VSAASAAAQLAFVPPHLGLSWDETAYVSQVSAHAPAAYLDAARARGITLLVASVTLLTSPVAALRIYLSVAAGLGLFLAPLTWRQLRPTWALALAGLTFGGLWTAQYYGPRAMPDLCGWRSVASPPWASSCKRRSGAGPPARLPGWPAPWRSPRWSAPVTPSSSAHRSSLRHSWSGRGGGGSCWPRRWPGLSLAAANG